jgi:hypothetical protein
MFFGFITAVIPGKDFLDGRCVNQFLLGRATGVRTSGNRKPDCESYECATAEI